LNSSSSSSEGDEKLKMVAFEDIKEESYSPQNFFSRVSKGLLEWVNAFKEVCSLSPPFSFPSPLLPYAHRIATLPLESGPSGGTGQRSSRVLFMP
jgi:hypothetical protein